MSDRRARKGSGGTYVRAGRVYYQLDLGMVQGKRIRKTFAGSSEHEAREKAAQWQRERENGLDPEEMSSLTVGRLLDRWLAHLDLTMHPTRPRTFLSYRQTAEQHIRPSLGEMRLRTVTPGDVERMVAKAMAGGLSVRSATYQRNVLRIAINWAMREGWAARNVAGMAKMPTDRPPPRAVLTIAQAKKIIGAPHRLRVLWLLALTTGLRVGELCGLRWGDVDFERGVLHVRRQIQRIEGELLARPTKTDGSTATILLPALTIAALRQQHHVGQYLFTSKRRAPYTGGGPLEPRNVTRSWHVHLRNLGIPPVKMHATRYTCGSLLYDAGVPDKVIQSVLRHARIGTTMDIYVQPGEMMQRSAADAMDRILSE